jgi:hypothetical protein
VPRRASSWSPLRVAWVPVGPEGQVEAKQDKRRKLDNRKSVKANKHALLWVGGQDMFVIPGTIISNHPTTIVRVEASLGPAAPVRPVPHSSPLHPLYLAIPSLNPYTSPHASMHRCIDNNAPPFVYRLSFIELSAHRARQSLAAPYNLELS